MFETIGILGLGQIGGTAARLLVAAGYPVAAVNRPSAAWLPDAGGMLVPDAASLAGSCPIVIGAMSREEDVEDAVFGAAGLVAGAPQGLIYADMGTFAVALKERIRDVLAVKGAVVLDTPISGTPQAMESGAAVIMRSGDEAASEQVRPVMEVLAGKSPHVGPFGHGMKLKFVLNALVTNHVLVAAEAINMGVASGLDALGRVVHDVRQVLDVVSASVATSKQFELRGPRMAEQNYQPAPAPARLVNKDMRYIVEHAAALGVAAPVSNLTRKLYEKVAEMGRLDDELSVIFEALKSGNNQD
ncbi:MAG: NAD(P)-dependent oxidoreductase [Alphaproteobacteria bacterium]